MTLEDHLGDIIRKARQAANVSKEAAASAAGLTPAQLEELEENGQTAKKPDLGKLAPIVGLDASKLNGIANGWLPQETDLGMWRELRQITTTQRMSVNCY